MGLGPIWAPGPYGPRAPGPSWSGWAPGPGPGPLPRGRIIQQKTHPEKITQEIGPRPENLDFPKENLGFLYVGFTMVLYVGGPAGRTSWAWLKT